MWVKLEVFNDDQYLGSFFTDSQNKQDIISDINKEYGEGKWTKYNIGN